MAFPPLSFFDGYIRSCSHSQSDGREADERGLGHQHRPVRQGQRREGDWVSSRGAVAGPERKKGRSGGGGTTITRIKGMLKLLWVLLLDLVELVKSSQLSKKYVRKPPAYHSASLEHCFLLVVFMLTIALEPYSDWLIETPTFNSLLSRFASPLPPSVPPPSRSLFVRCGSLASLAHPLLITSLGWFHSSPTHSRRTVDRSSIKRSPANRSPKGSRGSSSTG
jgi:hypothetical protein